MWTRGALNRESIVKSAHLQQKPFLSKQEDLLAYCPKWVNDFPSVHTVFTFPTNKVPTVRCNC